MVPENSSKTLDAGFWGSTSRRQFLVNGVLACAASKLLGGCSGPQTDLRTLWKDWHSNWRRMQETARKRQWEVTTLDIAPPAAPEALAIVESRYQMLFPSQLRAVLTQLSGCVTFGWYTPNHLSSFGRLDMPQMSFNRDAVWDLSHINSYALPNFVALKSQKASESISEALNFPEMWENQFPFYYLKNGDIVTIDVSDPDPQKQPVRYFSHELEMLHGLALAPDFFSFMTEMSKLGFAGTEWASWLRFGDNQQNDRYYLSSDSEGAKAWIKWLERDPENVGPDEPPQAVVETTPADRALLESARANSVSGVKRALRVGAHPDCVPGSDWISGNFLWDHEFSTAITYAVRNSNLDMLEILLGAGAILNTRRLPLNDAVKESSLATVRWLIAKGARVDGWKHQRYFPLHDLVVTRRQIALKTRSEYRQQINKTYGTLWPDLKEAELKRKLNAHISYDEYLIFLRTLLAAGADPNAAWDNGITMLAWGDEKTAEVLLAYGANPNARDDYGKTPLHTARTGRKVRILAGAGADVNLLASHSTEASGLSYTPLQAALLHGKLEGDSPIKALLDLGADPKKKDAGGRTTLTYCHSERVFRLVMVMGVDPHALQPNQQTLLHNLVIQHGLPRHDFSDEVAFLDFLLALGIDINARDGNGRTMLHYAAEEEIYDESFPNYELAIARGADEAIRDNAGKRPVELVARSLKKVRSVLARKQMSSDHNQSGA
ncbi:Ankyrin repeats (3 copies) [Pseudovibrio sp. Ad14]|nr:Ankyrin repeats (3 copies) [Pseudovibrio sp. W74]KZL10413.1 Ankyrin repeats (3 copies) [Pseudovibrio sp. Ad14]